MYWRTKGSTKGKAIQGDDRGAEPGADGQNLVHEPADQREDRGQQDHHDHDDIGRVNRKAIHQDLAPAYRSRRTLQFASSP